MDIKQKYASLRSQIAQGDIILVRGTSFLARTIEWADKSTYSHALLVYGKGDRLLAIQSMAQGVQPDFLSTEIFNNVDFCIIKPKFDQAIKDDAVNKCFVKAEDGIPYNTWELPKILLKLRLGIGFKNMQGPANKNICSVFTGYTYASLLPITRYVEQFNKAGFLTPQDLIRFASPSEVEVIGDDHP